MMDQSTHQASKHLRSFVDPEPAGPSDISSSELIKARGPAVQRVVRQSFNQGATNSQAMDQMEGTYVQPSNK